MERPRHFEDYTLDETRKTQGRTITETDFVVHAGHTGDFFPHHMDAEFMKDTQFGQRIAHGTMTFAIGMALAGAAGGLYGTVSQINPYIGASLTLKSFAVAIIGYYVLRANKEFDALTHDILEDASQ